MARFKAHALLSLLSKIIRPNVKVRASEATPRVWEHQKPSQISKLPAHILFIIADHLSLTDRARLLQICRYFRSSLEVTQYRHINTPNHDQSDHLHRTLLSRPEFIPYIISYRGPLTPTPLTPRVEEEPGIQPHIRNSTTPPDTEMTSFRRAIYIFTNAINLRGLEFTDCSDWISDPMWEPVRTSILKMPLTRLVLLTKSTGVVSLLRALPRLESLELLWIPTRLKDLKESDIPDLRSLKATLEDAATLIPGRPVREFHHLIRGQERTLDEQLVRKLSLSSSPITKLTTRLHDSRDHELFRSTLQIFARHLPEIQHLTITVNGIISDQMLLDEIPSFKCLRSLKFLGANLYITGNLISSASRLSIDSDDSTGSGITPQMPMVNGWDALLLRLQAQCPSLVNIEHTPRPGCKYFR